MNVLHLAPDDKFLPFVQKTFESVYPGRNRFRLLAWDANIRFAVPSPDTRIVDRRYFFSRSLKDDLRWSDCLVVHFMTPWFAKAIAEAPDRVMVVWSAWGADFYDLLPGYGDAMYLPETRRLMARVDEGRRPNARERLRRLLDRAMTACLPRWDRDVVARIDVLSTVIPSEYRMLERALPGFRARHHQLYYGSAEDTFMKGPGHVCGDDILVGNSATPTGNHVEALLLLARAALGSRRIVVPLSYGDHGYAGEVCGLGARLFGERFVALSRFLPLADYSAQIARCSLVLMNHVRQQAVGTINAALYAGAKVFLRPENPLTEHYRSLGLSISEIRERFEEDDARVLSQAQVEGNRAVLRSVYGRERAVAAVRALGELADARTGRVPA